LSASEIVTKPTPRLHNSKTNWDTYRQIIQDNVNLSVKFKEHEDKGLETNSLLSLLLHAANEANPKNDSQRPTNNIPYEIEKLVAEKGRARSVWQRTHTPESRRKYNRISNILKSKLQEMRNESFGKYIPHLKRQGNSIWKPIKIRENLKQHHTKYANIHHLRDHVQEATRRKLNYSQNVFPKFSLHIRMIRIRNLNKTHSIARMPYSIHFKRNKR
jgi:hypothetical protein